MSEKKQKLGLLSCILMAIGSIIGASIFATTPVAIKIVGGNGVVLGFILAAVVVVLRTLPELIMMAALPANGASYMYFRIAANRHIRLPVKFIVVLGVDSGRDGAKRVNIHA